MRNSLEGARHEQADIGRKRKQETRLSSRQVDVFCYVQPMANGVHLLYGPGADDS